jgi:succinoglycan biosynthesis transport protein ExoP
MLMPSGTPAAIDEAERQQSVDLRWILNFLWRQWKVILSVMGAALIVGAAYLAIQTRLYTATTQILLDPRKEKAAGSEAILSDFNLDMASIESQMAIIRSTSLLRRVVEKERLVTHPEFGTPPKEETSVEAPGSNSEQIKAAEAAAALTRSVNRLRLAMTVARTGQAYVLSISVTSADRQLAARLANAIADAYVVDKLDARFEAAQRASAWLGDRLVDLRKQLRESEEAVARFRTEHGLQQGTANATLNQDQLSQLNARLVTVKAETAEKKARLDLLRNVESRGQNVQNVPDFGNSGLLATLKTQEADISRREADLVARYGDAHPLVVNIRAEKRDIQRAITNEARRISENIKNEYALAKSREETLEKTLRDVSGQTGADSQTAITLRELERTTAVNKSLFEEFLQRAKITQEQSTFEAREARIITPAVPPNSPSSPKKTQWILVAAVLGLLLGIGAAAAIESLNTGYNTPSQIEHTLGLPVLTTISSLAEKDLTINEKVYSIPLYIVARPLSRFSEALRSLRSGIQMTDVDSPPKVIQVTSTLPGEGKTSVVLSLAASAASSNLKVLVVDGDLRNPSASRFVGRNKEPGLVELLVGEIDIRNVIKMYEPGKFWMLCAGGKTQNPPDLLASERMRSLVKSFADMFDYVIIDTPPLGPVIDPVVISQIVDKVVYVVRWGSTPREIVGQSIQKLGGHKKIAGIVLNQVDDSHIRKYGKNAYAYYGTGYYKDYYSH